MRRENIDRGWEYSDGRTALGLFGAGAGRTVDLPHDYMIEQDRDPAAVSGAASGYYTAHVGIYRKWITVPAEWEGGKVGLRFDGAMLNATLEVNGCKAFLQHYGYAPFFADITPFVYFGQENLLTVTLHPATQPNSRWYSGAGLYRSVELVHTPPVHIENDGIFARTADLLFDALGRPESARILTEVDVRNDSLENVLARVNVTVSEESGGRSVCSGSTLVQVHPGKRPQPAWP